MKKFIKIASIVAASNLLCFWLIYGLLMAVIAHVTLWQFFGFAPASPSSHFFDFLLWMFVILSAPASILMDGVSSTYFTFALILCSALNSIIWGICLACPIYGVSKRVRHVAA
jgi:hypothetical protein